MAPERPGNEDERCGPLLVHTNGAAVPAARHHPLHSGDLLKEGDGAAKVFTEVRVGSASAEDDDLTPLSWLQDRNLLKGITLRGGPVCPDGAAGEARRALESREPRDEEEEEQPQRRGSPTSDYAEDSSDQPDSSAPVSPAPSVTVPVQQAEEALNLQLHPSIIPYNPKVHVTSKPPYSFSCLIFMAIEDSMQRALPVKDIYAWILDHFPYFQSAPTGWKNSVRHNLSLNKCFKKVDKSPNVGKGSLWMVDPTYRPNLLQALRKAPYHPYMKVDRQPPPSGPGPALTQTNVMVNKAMNGGGSSNSSTSSSSSGSHHNPSEYSMPVLLNAPAPTTPGRSNLPNPALFPFLSRRLAAAGLGLPSSAPPRAPERLDEEDSDSREDVDAANAMLALKHGPRILQPRRDEWYKRPRDGKGEPADDERSLKRMRLILTPQQETNGVKPMVITSSPSEDHTYSAGATGTGLPNGSSRPALSPDEAFGEGSVSSAAESCHDNKVDSEGEEAEEQRKIAEGADALLNLAGICTGPRNTKRAAVVPARLSKRQRLSQEARVAKRPPAPPPQPPPRLWKKASLHQGSRAHKGKSKSGGGRPRR